MKKILLIEDNDIYRMVMVRRLLMAGYAVEFAADGGSGLSMIASTNPDVVLLDMHLPVMDGWDVVRKAKADPGTRDIPIIGLISEDDPLDRETALNSGCDDFVLKTISHTDLLERLKSIPPFKGS